MDDKIRRKKVERRGFELQVIVRDRRSYLQFRRPSLWCILSHFTHFNKQRERQETTVKSTPSVRP